MKRVNLTAVLVIVFVVFVASSFWYSPLLFGQEFLKFSGGAAAQASALKVLCELLRTFVLAYVIARLLARLDTSKWQDALGIGLTFWIGFPVILLTGSVLWQNVPWQLAAIHSGDWLIKSLLIPVNLTIWRQRAVRRLDH